MILYCLLYGNITPASMGLQNSVLSVCKAYRPVLTRGCHLRPPHHGCVEDESDTDQETWAVRAFLVISSCRLGPRAGARESVLLIVGSFSSLTMRMRSLLPPLLLAY